MEQKIPIVEIFESIQAEGPLIGVPSIFVRVYGCSLHCRFKGESCDTPYAVSKEKDKAVFMTVDEVEEKIRSYNSTNIVFTGGEPTLYQKFLLKLMENLWFYYSYEIETNGTILLTNHFENSVSQFNISLKLKSSNQLNKTLDKRRINYNILKSFSLNKSYFKFVITNPKEDIKEIQEILKKLSKVYNVSCKEISDKVYLMPEGINRKDIIKHSPEVVNLCIKNGYKFSPREHIIIWNGKRGQ